MLLVCFSQSLINLFITGTAVTNVWDNDKDVSGMSKSSIIVVLTTRFISKFEMHSFLIVVSLICQEWFFILK